MYSKNSFTSLLFAIFFIPPNLFLQEISRKALFYLKQIFKSKKSCSQQRFHIFGNLITPVSSRGKVQKQHWLASQCYNTKNPAVEGRGSLTSSFRPSGLAQGKSTEKNERDGKCICRLRRIHNQKCSPANWRWMF